MKRLRVLCLTLVILVGLSLDRAGGERISFATRAAWQEWTLPTGAVELTPDGEIRLVPVRKGIDAVADAADFGGGIRAVGSNRGDAGLLMDGDPATGWAPLASDDPEKWWIEIDLGRLVTAEKVHILFTDDAPPLEFVNVLLSNGEKFFTNALVPIDNSLVFNYSQRFGFNEEQVLELFMELGADDEQTDFPVVYAIGRDGASKKELKDEMTDLTPVLDLIMEHVPAAPSYNEGDELRAQAFNLGYDDFTGRLAIARIYEGKIENGKEIMIKGADKEGVRKAKITKLSTFKGIEQVPTDVAYAGDIVLIAGLSDINIGETITTNVTAKPLPAIAVDEPTIGLEFMLNASPFAGREGKYVTGRQIKERLEKELEINVGLQVDFANMDAFKVYGRGEMHISILLENMRREGYELAVSQPQVIIREVDGKKQEPFEEVTIDIPAEFQGVVIERLSNRAFIMQNLVQNDNQIRLTFEGPTRGLLGYRGMFVSDTKGEGILSSRVIGFKPMAGEVKKRSVGSMISMETGKSLGFSLWNLQDRGVLYIGHATEVYEGMVIGNTSKGDDMTVNPTKGKQLSNIRSSSSDEALILTPPQLLTIEMGLEVMSDDELLEVTPKSVRLRKRHLKENARASQQKPSR